MKRGDDWGIMALPDQYQLSFKFSDECCLELKSNDYKTLNSIQFMPLSLDANWIEVRDFEDILKELFKEKKFDKSSIDNFLKKMKEVEDFFAGFRKKVYSFC